jgi:beta-glucosidase-like glycosyl hydrolase
MKLELNLFEGIIANSKDYPKFGSQEFIKTAYNAAAESITLLKNKNTILPLSKNENISYWPYSKQYGFAKRRLDLYLARRENR